MIYSNKNNSFSFTTSNGTEFVHRSIWMIASKSFNGWIMLVHGPEENVKKRYDNICVSFEDAGLYQEIDDMYLFDVTDFGIEEINKCIEITNYIGRLVEADIFSKKAKEMIC